MSFNRNNYVTLENYNKQIKEKYGFSSYEIQKASYPKEIEIKNQQQATLSNYNSSGVVSTNPAYNVGEQNPGLSWV
jgi:CTP-dependent riboflavin kinase